MEDFTACSGRLAAPKRLPPPRGNFFKTRGTEMKAVNFEEYQKAKNEIIGGIEYKEHTDLKEDGRIVKQYATEKNGTFYEITSNGVTEFWSDKHPDSRRYDGRTSEEIISQYEEVIDYYKKENANLTVLKNEYQRSMNDKSDLVCSLLETVKELKAKLTAIQTLTKEVAA